jgi:hypothetical protein
MAFLGWAAMSTLTISKLRLGWYNVADAYLSVLCLGVSV